MSSILQDYRDAIKNSNIVVVESGRKCKQVVRIIRAKCRKQKFVGFDVEWVTEDGERKPIALLQLSTGDGYCGLLRLCKMVSIPKCLSALLSDPDIIKLGVAPFDDAEKMLSDYNCKTKGTVDLRHLAALTGHNVSGLKGLSESILNVQMEKSIEVRCSNWSADSLTDKQIDYAAADAILAVEIYKELFTDFARVYGEPITCHQILMYRDIKFNQYETSCPSYCHQELLLLPVPYYMVNNVGCFLVAAQLERPCCSGHQRA
ncbi:exonuclease 3'-5' domain-containing protein 2-like [Teleopsis dalmanni]|uniref:exonuclease 3'-5' domain-containing protein 2-like n=1 Tax=Teleopsis dalmanni TaxID=139649 RepID=UPI0018CF91B3|nr:exonuclease 3'-5' domain-containing protein 2-like [Teleopsis dalmanni]